MGVQHQLSSGPDDHIHRIGRTGRAGVPGRAVTFLDNRESKEAREVWDGRGGWMVSTVVVNEGYQGGDWKNGCE